jgi:hypothetical protein
MKGGEAVMKANRMLNKKEPRYQPEWLAAVQYQFPEAVSLPNCLCEFLKGNISLKSLT